MSASETVAYVEGAKGRFRVLRAIPDGFYQVQEQFGSYRLTRKHFRTEDAAIKRAEAMAGDGATIERVET